MLYIKHKLTTKRPHSINTLPLIRLTLSHNFTISSAALAYDRIRKASCSSLLNTFKKSSETDFFNEFHIYNQIVMQLTRQKVLCRLHKLLSGISNDLLTS